VRVLTVAVSARMLAQLAVADGYQVTALDRFGDVDLRAVAPGATASSNDALAALAAGVDADAVVYGGGLENRPDLVQQLAHGRELLGTPPELLAAANSSGGVLGKMLSPQNLTIAAAAVKLEGQEGVLLRKVIGWSLGMLVVLSVLIALQATPVLGWMLP